MLNVPLRRVFRFLWGLAAIAILAGLPTLILDFRHSGYSVHYQACTHTRLPPLLCACHCPSIQAYHSAHGCRKLLLSRRNLQTSLSTQQYHN